MQNVLKMQMQVVKWFHRLYDDAKYILGIAARLCIPETRASAKCVYHRWQYRQMPKGNSKPDQVDKQIFLTWQSVTARLGVLLFF